MDMPASFWPPQEPDSFTPPANRKDADWNWQRMQDLEDEYYEAKATLLPSRIDRPLEEVIVKLEAWLVPQIDDQIENLRTMPYRQFLKTDHWRKTREAALERSRGECAVCASHKNLDVHHRTYERRGCETANDLIVLCRSCHDLFHRNSKLAEPE